MKFRFVCKVNVVSVSKPDIFMSLEFVKLVHHPGIAHTVDLTRLRALLLAELRENLLQHDLVVDKLLVHVDEGVHNTWLDAGCPDVCNGPPQADHNDDYF